MLTLKTTINRSNSYFEELTVNGTETISSLLISRLPFLPSYEKARDMLNQLGVQINDGVWHLTCFHTVERFRGHGFGKKLMQEHIFKKYTGGFIILECRPELVPMYHHLGFKILCRHTSYYEMYKDLRNKT